MSDVVYYIISAVLTVGVLVGIAMMSKVKSAPAGNILSAVCMAVAILVTLYRYEILSDAGLWVAMAVGLALGAFGAQKVKMIEMPQAVALLNGFGGAASAIVGVMELIQPSVAGAFSSATAGLAVAVGMLTLTGSLVAAAKLHGLIGQKPVVWNRHALLTIGSLVVTAVTIVLITVDVAVTPMTLLCLVFSGFFGVAFAIRVGGADMPITISLLNSFSGVAAGIAGLAIADPLLVAIGGVVGASGLLLTQIMCKAMNRHLMDILLGKTSAAAKQVIIVPGYGMALAQAQALVKQLADRLENQGTQVRYAIHPVAGRMPGHMNVLLAEVDVPYEQLCEMDDINPEFAACDVCVIVGANDVINPAANTAEGTPIYGMPVLNVENARHLIICNYDLKPGYAGVENPLYTKKGGVTMMLGDAKDSLQRLLDMM